MAESDEHPSVSRLRRNEPGLFEILSGGIPGADLTSLLLEVMRHRVGLRTAADVLHQYERDRFVRPAAVDPLRLMRIETQVLASVVPPFEPVQLAPLAPFGAHAAFAGVNQNRVVTTVRGNEVVADPTNVLALEAAVRRRAIVTSDPRSPESVRLAAVSRVVLLSSSTRRMRFRTSACWGWCQLDAISETMPSRSMRVWST